MYTYIINLKHSLKSCCMTIGVRGYQENMTHIFNSEEVIGAHRESRGKHGACLGLCCSCEIGFFVKFLTVGEDVSLTLDCLWVCFSPPGSPHWATIRVSVHSLIAPSDAVLGWYHWKICSFMTESEAAADHGQRGAGVGRRGGSGGNGWNVFYKRRTKKNLYHAWYTQEGKCYFKKSIML